MWHIWTGITSVTHPPLYYLTLRGWIDLFGDGDRATRMMSLVFSLGAIAVLFDAVRRGSSSTAQGLAAAAMMALAPAQIDFSQTTRPYTMIEFLALLAVDLLIVIQMKGPSKLRVIGLFAALVATAMTHYFTAGFFIAMGIFALLGLKGNRRKAVVVTLISAAAFVLIVWGPMFWRARGLVELDGYVRGKGLGIYYLFFNLPRRLLLHLSLETGFLAMWAMAAVIYFSPLLRMKREPQLLLWWLWAVCVPGFLLMWDTIRQTHFISVTRYVLLASPAMFAIFATPLPTRLGKFVPLAFVFAAAVSAFARWQAGPPPTADIRDGARLIATDVPAHDPVIVVGDLYFPKASFSYFAIAHYIGEWTHPVVLLQAPANAALQAELAKYPRVWIWCNDAVSAGPLLPGRRLARAVHRDGYYLTEADR
jgi:4-amino-4-deoxy-L-arabinose transferase-like glycosyltransferase